MLVEAQQRAQSRAGERLAHPCQAVRVQASEVHALLEINLHLARCLQRAIPVMMRVDVSGQDDLRLAAGTAGGGYVVAVVSVIVIVVVMRVGHTAAFGKTPRPGYRHRRQEKSGARPLDGPFGGASVCKELCKRMHTGVQY